MRKPRGCFADDAKGWDEYNKQWDDDVFDMTPAEIEGDEEEDEVD